MAFNFAVIGNIVDKDGSYTKLDELIPKIVSRNPGLLVVMGNLTLDGSEQSVRTAYDKLYSFNSRFGIPVEATPGESELVDGEIPSWYKAHFGEPLASFQAGGINFISLNTSSKKLDSKQLDFLSRQLTTPSFVLSYCPPPVGFWEIDGLQEGTEDFLSVLSDKKPFVLGTVFSCVRSSGVEDLVDKGMVIDVPAFLVGNSGGSSYVLGKFGYSKTSPNSALVVTVREGVIDYEFL